MNIKQNIVCIKTGTQMGSGIIYPCECSGNNLDSQSFIIFTNKHVVDDISVDDEKLKCCVDFDIYDKNGKLVEIDKKSDKVKLQLFYDEKSDEDIAAFLLTFEYKIELDLEMKVIFDDSNLTEIFIEGFPQVLQNDKVSSKLQMRGYYKSIFPENERIGIFQIKDDYHWYSNYKDLRLFQGFSGGAVYKSEGDANYIVGMNQSILNIDDGENPFKLLYYYKIRFILEYLRERGCIIFKKNKDLSIKIRWIKDGCKQNSKLNSEQNEINLLLLGSSGAGKSSFAKTFLLNANSIDSTNDGQTTRTNIIYSLEMNSKKSKMDVEFLTQKEFLNKMEKLNYRNYLLKIASLITGNSELKTVEDYLRHFFASYPTYMKYVNDTRYSRDEKIEEYITVGKNIEKMSEILTLPKNTEYEGDVLIYLENILNKALEGRFNYIEKNREEIDQVLKYVEGFFDVSEFDFLYKKNYSHEVNKVEDKEDKDSKEQGKVKKYFIKYYEDFHKNTIELLIANNFVRKNLYSMEISLNNPEENEELIPLCLQVKDGNSLTGLIDYVYIEDSISNDYAMILDDLNIKTLKLIDTYGLDHSNWDEGQTRILRDIVFELSEGNLIHFNSDLAVIYVKKLDSGKPTELKTILPEIFNVIPQSPVYCVFNGIDVFYGSNIEDVEVFDYFNENQKLPKSIKYLMSEDGKRQIIDNIRGRDDFIENLYQTLKNNIVSFCSNKNIIENYINIYDNNISEVNKLLLSICMKEYSSIEIIPDDFIKDVKNGDYDDWINEITEKIFEESSKTDWTNLHYKTVRANSDRIKVDLGEKTIKKLGYNGTYDHQWNRLFHDGYVKAISKSGENSISSIERGEDKSNYYTAVDSCIKNMEYRFLGKPSELIYANKDEGSEENKGEFRVLIEEMYKDSDKFGYNPFEPSGYGSKVNTVEKEREFLKVVCDFKKGYPVIKDEIVAYFRKCFVEQMEEENKAKSKNILRLNNDFYEELNILKYKFERKYSDINFYELLKYAINEENL